MLDLVSNYKETWGRTVFLELPTHQQSLCRRKTNLCGRKSISECVCGQQRDTEERWALMQLGQLLHQQFSCMSEPRDRSPIWKAPPVEPTHVCASQMWYVLVSACCSFWRGAENWNTAQSHTETKIWGFEMCVLRSFVTMLKYETPEPLQLFPQLFQHGLFISNTVTKVKRYLQRLLLLKLLNRRQRAS